MLTTLAEKISPENAALLIIDMQNDFWNPEAPPAKLHGRDVSMASAMIDRLLALVARARAAGLPIIHVRHEEPGWAMSESSNELRWQQKARRTAALPNIDYQLCQPGTFGVEFYRVVPEPGDIVVTKHRYSAFVGTDLGLVLRSLNRKSLLLCGGSTNICLESTTRDGFMLDYYCVVVGDCSATAWGDAAHRAALANIELGFGQVADLANVCEAWGEHRNALPRAYF